MSLLLFFLVMTKKRVGQHVLQPPGLTFICCSRTMQCIDLLTHIPNYASISHGYPSGPFNS